MTPLLNTQQVAQQIGMHPDTLRSWRNHGNGPAWIKVGSRYRYTEEAIKAFLDAQNQAPIAALLP